MRNVAAGVEQEASHRRLRRTRRRHRSRGGETVWSVQPELARGAPWKAGSSILAFHIVSSSSASRVSSKQDAVRKAAKYNLNYKRLNSVHHCWVDREVERRLARVETKARSKHANKKNIDEHISRRGRRSCCMSEDEFSCRYYVGHKGKFGHEFLEFEFRSDGRLRYANNSNYKQETIIRKEVHVSPSVLAEVRRIVEESEVVQETDKNWPKPMQEGRQEFELQLGGKHISLATSKIGSLLDVQVWRHTRPRARTQEGGRAGSLLPLLPLTPGVSDARRGCPLLHLTLVAAPHAATNPCAPSGSSPTLPRPARAHAGVGRPRGPSHLLLPGAGHQVPRLLADGAALPHQAHLIRA